MDTRPVAGMAGALLLLAAAPVYAQDRYGGRGGYEDFATYGLSWDYAAKIEVIGAAVNACRRRGGVACVPSISDGRVRVSYP